MRFSIWLATLFVVMPLSLNAQWLNRYPHVDSFGHQIYLEGNELPIMTSGPMDPAASPLGDAIVFSAKGWLWVMDLESGNARRITHSGGIDSRPEWSPNGEDIVFVRDDSKQLDIVSVNVDSGQERVLVDVEAINFDPVFSPDGKYVYYSSAESGPLYLWRVALDSLDREKVSPSTPLQKRSIERRPIVLAQDSLIVYLKKQGTNDSIEILNTVTKKSSPLVEDRLAAQADFSLSPDGRYMAYSWPFDGGYELRLLEIATPNTSVLLTRSLGMPLAPAFSHDGQWIYFSEANDNERMELKRVSVSGGVVVTLPVNAMDWGANTGTLLIQSTINGQSVPVRMNVLDESGHPIIPETGMVRSEGQNGRVFYYSNGEIELTAPAGKVTVSAVNGFETPEWVRELRVRSNKTTEVTIDLERIWDASEHGWYSADNHFHLNYGGQYRLVPEDMLPDLRAENVDVAWPLLANLHNRFLQQDLWGWSYPDGPIINFGQEVRSHFLGHLGLMGTKDLFWPWVWGPGYQLYGEDDRTNAEVLRFSRSDGGLGGYMHPVANDDPFGSEPATGIPTGFIADAVLGDIDFIELGCLWSDEVGTGAVWHEVLNLGIPMAASAGSDVMNDYYRTMAIGAARVYVKLDGELNTNTYLQAFREGKSFVSNGPMLEFTVGGKNPGEVVALGSETMDWDLEVHSALPFDKVEIFVNGAVVQTLEGNSQFGSKRYQGTVVVPDGGWVTVRVMGENTGWPALDSYLFAETSPIWFGQVGSTDPKTLRASAERLLAALNASEEKMTKAYGSAPIPKLLTHFAKARERLESMVD